MPLGTRMVRSMKKILITGSLGLTGSACVELFREEGWEVVGVDNNSRSTFFGTKRQNFPGEYKFYELDLRDEDEVENLFKQKFDAVVHCAAQPSHDYATDHVLEDFDVNARATVILLEATRKYCPDAVFVHVSTDKVYGENMEVPLEEQLTRYVPAQGLPEAFNESLGLDFARDRSFFGCSKAASDMYAQEYAARFNMKVGIFRPGCITGKNHQGAEQHGFLAYLAKCIREGKPYTVYGFKGKQVRDQIHARDIARAFGAFIANPRTGAVYNIGGGLSRSVSVLEAAQLLEEATGKPAILTFAEGRKGDRCYDVHDITTFKKDFPDWDYQYSLEDIIKDLSI